MQTSCLAHTRGLTLIELLLTVSLCAVLLGAGIPGFRNLIYKHQRDSSTQRLSSLLALARSTAVKHNRITWRGAHLGVDLFNTPRFSDLLGVYDCAMNSHNPSLMGY